MTDRPNDRLSDDALERFFSAARAEGDAAPLSDGFLGRVMADAAAELPRAEVAASAQPRPAGGWRRGAGAGLWAALGGWGGASGLVAATAVGVWIGVAQPVDVPGLVEAPVELTLMAESDIFGMEG